MAGWALLALLVACSSDDPARPDEAPDASLDDAEPSIVIEAPTPPAPPVFTPCPEGWRERAIDDLVACEPYPEGRQDCSDIEIHVPGTTGCVRVGHECPAGGFPATIPTAADVRYVRAGAAGTGTRSAPFGTIGEALRAVAAEGTVVVAPGTYREQLRIERAVTLLGACASETIIEAPADAVAAVLVTAGPASLRDLTVRGARTAVYVTVGANLNVEDVRVERFAESGLRAVGGTLTAQRFSIRAVAGTEQVGLLTSAGGHLLAERGAVVGMRLYAGACSEGAELTVRDVGIIGGPPDDAVRGGVEAHQDATATLERVAIEGTCAFGVGSSLRSTLRATDVVVRDTHAQEPDALRGAGAGIELRATLELSRVLFERAVFSAILSTPDGGSIAATDVAILDTRNDPVEHRARGLSLAAQTHATLDRVRVRGGTLPALLLAADGTSVTARDLDVADVGASPTFGVGALHAQLASVLRGERIRVRRTTSAGLVLMDGARGSLEDVAIEDTRAELRGDLGRGITVQNAGLFGRRVRVARNREVSVMVYGPRAVARFEELEIDGTMPRACAEDTCADSPAGFGVISAQGALEIDRFKIAGSALCGALVTEAGMLDLAHGEVRANVVGVCMQVDGYELDRLRDDVVYADNGAPLEATMLPVPEPLGGTR